MTTPLFERVNLLKGRKLEWKVEDRVSVFPGRPDVGLYVPQVDYPGLFKAYGMPESKTFAEKIVNLENPQDLYADGDITLRLGWVTSPDTLAHRRGIVPRGALNSLAACGLLVTADDKIVIGMRGGAITSERVKLYGSGLWGAPPGGSATFKTQYKHDPITDTLIAEAGEELGVPVRAYGTIGTVEANTPGPIGLKFVGLLRTDAKLREIQALNTVANTMWDDYLARGVDKKEIKERMHNSGLPPDAWEHSRLEGLPNDPAKIRDAMAGHPVFIGVTAGTLEMYAQALEQNILPDKRIA